MAQRSIQKGAGRLWEKNIDDNFTELFEGLNVSITRAEAEVLSTYGDTVSVAAKSKSLLKFGANSDLDTGVKETIWSQGDDETYVTTNAIDTISSSDASDTEDVTIEYHTVVGTGSSAVYTFGVQTATLDGQNKVVLDVPCARVSRAYNSGATSLVGDVYVYEDTSIISGVPTDGTKVHVKVNAGDNKTFKAATTISGTDYCFITQVYGSVKRSTSAVVDFRLETRLPGGIFLPIIEWSASQTGGTVPITLDPYVIIPKNTDIRITGESNTTNVTADAGFGSYLAAVQ